MFSTKNKNKFSQESLWLDEKKSNKLASKLLQNDKFQSKMLKLIQHFDSSSTVSLSASKIEKQKISKLTISNPISFTHVSHVDTEFNFGVNESFNKIDADVFDTLLPTRKAPSISRRSVSSSVSSLNRNSLVQYQSTLDPGNFKAFSSYRTSPTPNPNNIKNIKNIKNINPISSSMKSHNHKRSSSCSTALNISSSQFSSDSTFTPTNSFRMSYNSESSIGSPLTNELSDVKILPCIPQTEENDKNIGNIDDSGSRYADKFRFIPSAPPPPPTKIKPVDRLKSFIENRQEIEVASDSDDDEDLTLTKFRFSSNVELVMDEIQNQLQKRLSNDNNLTMSKKCRDSIMFLLKNENEDQEFLMNLLNETQLSLHKAIPRSNKRDTSILNIMSDIKEEEEIEEQEQEQEQGQEQGQEQEQQLFNDDEDTPSILNSINFSDDESLIDTTFNLDSNSPNFQISDFFGDLNIADPSLEIDSLKSII